MGCSFCDVDDHETTFGCKARYWRSNGAPGVTFQGGQWAWHQGTNKQAADQMVERAAADGRTIVPCDKNGEWR